MTIDDQLSDSAGSGLDRRSALKKAALAAGVVAWTTPVVQAVTARPVHAAGATNCAPVAEVTSILLGTNGICTNNPVPGNPCYGQTSFLLFDPRIISCGPLCAVSTWQITNVGGANVCNSDGAFVYFRTLSPACPPTVPGANTATTILPISANVTCADGSIQNGTFDVVIPCSCIPPGGVAASVLADMNASSEALLPAEETTTTTAPAETSTTAPAETTTTAPAETTTTAAPTTTAPATTAAPTTTLPATPAPAEDTGTTSTTP